MMVHMKMMMVTGDLTAKKWIVYCRPGKPGTRQLKHGVVGGFLLHGTGVHEYIMQACRGYRPVSRSCSAPPVLGLPPGRHGQEP